MRLYQKRLRDICFPVKFAKFLSTTILKNICEQLLLIFISKETPAQMFSCEFCELYKNTYLEEHPRTAGSETPARRVCITASGNILASGNISLKLFIAP